MPIHYGDLTIVYNPILQTWVEWIKGETNQKDQQYVFLFEDNEICELKDKYVNLNFEFLFPSFNTCYLPLYFQKPKPTDGVYFKDYTPNLEMIFSAYSKNDLSIPSPYNGIYYCHKKSLKPEVFGIKRIKSTENMPRYQFAYDTDEFTKDEMVYLLYSIFKKN